MTAAVSWDGNHREGKMSDLDFNHPEFFPCRCPQCGWEGMSNETEGGRQIADTGDFDDIVCPKCVAPNGDWTSDDAQWIAVEEIKKPECANCWHSEFSDGVPQMVYCTVFQCRMRMNETCNLFKQKKSK